jgi:hypothetical protein
MSDDDPTHAHCRRMIDQGVPGHAQGEHRGHLASYFCYNSVVATFYIAGSTSNQLRPVRDALIDGWVNGTARATPSTFRREHFRQRRDEWKDVDEQQYEKHEAFYLANRHEMI